MRRTTNVALVLSFLAIWILSVVSIPFIPERCIVCGEREHSGDADLRTLSIVEWVLDTVPDFHFSCSPEYDAVIHNPNGGIK